MKKEDYYKKLDNAINYIEKNLNKKISLASISENAFSSLSHFHRIFFFMTGFTIKEYIRERRLSYAAIQLISTNKKIIDIAFESQFETPESFNKSFKKKFGFSPRTFRTKRPAFSLVRKLELMPKDIIIFPANINLNFTYLAEQLIVGVKTRTSLANHQQTKDIPSFFAKVMQKGQLKNIKYIRDNNQILGIYSDMTDKDEFDYTVGVLVESLNQQDSKYATHILPATEYARFTVQGGPDVLEDAWQFIYGRWMPNSGQARQKGLDFEIYYPDKTEIYIPMHPNK